EQLAWLARRGTVQDFPARATVFAEGEPAEGFFMLLSGTLALSRRVQQDDVETNRTDQRGVYMGATQAYLPEDPAVPRTYTASMRGKLGMLADGRIAPEQLRSLTQLVESMIERAAKAPELTALQTSDREDELGEWLDAHHVRAGWDLAPVFVAGGIDVECLEE